MIQKCWILGLTHWFYIWQSACYIITIDDNNEYDTEYDHQYCDRDNNSMIICRYTGTVTGIVV